MSTNIEICKLKDIGEALGKIDTDLLLFVADSRLWQLHGKELSKYQPDKEKEVILFKALEGESTKTIEEFENGIEFFLEKGIHRQAHLVVIGGGATSDYGGFLASSLLRGLSWSVIPTTLLSMVDAAIGGKTGLNSKHGKNLLGSFHMPENVWIYPGFLETLSKAELDSGKGEIIKYGFLSEEVSDLLKKGADLVSIIEACAHHKEKVVQEDFKEKGTRVSLNLGHTFGHALERIYDISHGVAVFWGMALIFKLFGSHKEHLALLREYEKGIGADFGQPPWLNKTFPVMKIMDYVSKDKKRGKKKSLQIVNVKELGSFTTETHTFSDIENLLEDKKDELRTFNF